MSDAYFTSFTHPPLDLSSVDWTDPVSIQRARDEARKEKIILNECIAILKEQVSLCYKREGVNNIENCKHLSELYIQNVEKYQNVKNPVPDPFADIPGKRRRQLAEKAAAAAQSE